MDKKELIRRVNEELRETGQKKPIAVERHSFYVTDDDGNSAEFVVKERGRDVIYTASDVRKVLDACISVILKAIENGENINIYGFGNLKVISKKVSRMHHVQTGELIDVPAHSVPCFSAGAELKKAARIYGRTNLQSNDKEEVDV